MSGVPWGRKLAEWSQDKDKDPKLYKVLIDSTWWDGLWVCGKGAVRTWDQEGKVRKRDKTGLSKVEKQGLRVEGQDCEKVVVRKGVLELHLSSWLAFLALWDLGPKCPVCWCCLWSVALPFSPHDIQRPIPPASQKWRRKVQQAIESPCGAPCSMWLQVVV